MPTPWLAMVVALVAVPIALVQPSHWAPVAVGALVVGGLVVADFFAAVPPQSIEVVREFPLMIAVGDRAELTWVVANRSARTTQVTVADTLWPSFAATRRASSFRLGPRRQHRFGARIHPRRRGRFPLGAVTVRTRGPLRLVWRQQTREVSGTLAVMPAYPSREG